MAPKIYFQHFPGEASDAPAFYEAIGRNVVVWGRLEATLEDAMLRVMRHPEAVGVPQAVPAQFAGKLTLWKALCESEPLLANSRKRAARFVPDAIALAHRRNQLIHASIDALKADATATAFRFVRRRGKAAIETFKVGTESLNELLSDTLALYEQLSADATGALLRSMAARGRVHDNP